VFALEAIVQDLFEVCWVDDGVAIVDRSKVGVRGGGGDVSSVSKVHGRSNVGGGSNVRVVGSGRCNVCGRGEWYCKIFMPPSTSIAYLFIYFVLSFFMFFLRCRCSLARDPPGTPTPKIMDYARTLGIASEVPK
jgi:hypothetical protein